MDNRPNRPSEVALGAVCVDGACVCEPDGLRFGFLTGYDVCFNEQVEYPASQKCNIILIPGYQRGEPVGTICGLWRRKEMKRRVY